MVMDAVCFLGIYRRYSLASQDIDLRSYWLDVLGIHATTYSAKMIGI